MFIKDMHTPHKCRELFYSPQKTPRNDALSLNFAVGKKCK